MARVTQNDVLAVLAEYGKALPKRPAGDGWNTLDELASQSGQTRAAIRYQIACAQARGVHFETATGSVVDADGKAKRATFYRLRKAP